MRKIVYLSVMMLFSNYVMSMQKPVDQVVAGLLHLADVAQHPQRPSGEAVYTQLFANIAAVAQHTPEDQRADLFKSLGVSEADVRQARTFVDMDRELREHPDSELEKQVYEHFGRNQNPQFQCLIREVKNKKSTQG